MREVRPCVRHALHKKKTTRSFLSAFLCVCPEPVLVKRGFFEYNMAQKGQTISLPAGTVTLKLCPFADASSIDPGPEPFGTCGRRRSEKFQKLNAARNEKRKANPKHSKGGRRAPASESFAFEAAALPVLCAGKT